MKFVYHFGAHCTDEDRLLKCLFKNRGALGDRGINISAPGRFRPQIRTIIKKLAGGPANRLQQDELLESFISVEEPERVVLSNAAFFSRAPGVVANGKLYPMAGDMAQRFTRLFPDDQCEFFFALRNPATFLPAIAKQSGQKDFEKFLEATTPLNANWSETIASIRAACPDIPLTVWCNEDSPIIWHDILNRMAGIGPNPTLRGSYDFPAELITDEGIDALSNQLKTAPPTDAAQKRLMLAEMLEDFGRDEVMTEEIDLPGWTQERIDTLTERYDADVKKIAAMDGVTFLTP